MKIRKEIWLDEKVFNKLQKIASADGRNLKNWIEVTLISIAQNHKKADEGK